jgi:hypothetical protein
MHYWWNWSARGLKTSRTQTFWTDGKANIATPSQLLAHLKVHYPYLDLRDFSCELTTTLPQNKRAAVPNEVFMDDFLLDVYRRLSGKDKTLNDAGNLITPKRSIFDVRNPLQPGRGSRRPSHWL